MNLINKVFIKGIMVCISIVAVFPLQAQDVAARKASARNGAKMLMQKLSLSQEQADKIVDINTHFIDDMEVANTSTQDEKSKGEKRASLFQQKNILLKGILTSQQYTAYLQLIQEHQNKVKQQKKR